MNANPEGVEPQVNASERNRKSEEPFALHHSEPFARRHPERSEGSQFGLQGRLREESLLVAQGKPVDKNPGTGKVESNQGI